MKRQFAAFDIDGTLIRWQLYHAVIDNLAKEGHISSDTYSGVKEARLSWKKRANGSSFKSYEEQLVNTYHKLLPQLTHEQFEAAVLKTVNEYREQVYTYTRDLIKTLKEQNYLLFAISGSHHEVVAEVAKFYGFDDWYGAQYETHDGRFTGGLITPFGRKQEVLEELIKKHGAAHTGSYAIGDSRSDAAMLEMVDNPIAFNPDRTLFDIAKKQGWKVVIERKNMIYELEKSNGKYELQS